MFIIICAIINNENIILLVACKGDENIILLVACKDRVSVSSYLQMSKQRSCTA